MDWTSSRPGIVFDLLVILFQVFGVLALVLSRLFATPRWSERGQWAFMVAVVGLGVAGALSGHQDSEFGLFAEPSWLRRVDRIVMEVHAAFGDPDGLADQLRAAGFEATLLDDDLERMDVLGRNNGYLYAGWSITITTGGGGPAAPSTPDLAATSDTGASGTDNVTRDTTPTLSGTATEGTQVHIFDNGTQIGTAPIVGGAWTLTPTQIGTHLRMEQSGFRSDQPQNYAGAKYGWQKFISNLEEVLAKTSQEHS